MADEIVINSSIYVTNGYSKRSFAPGQILVDQNNQGRGGHEQLISASEETILDFGDIVTEGWAAFRNLDDTFSIVWGPSDGGTSGAMVELGKMKAGEPAGPIRLYPGVVIMAQAISEDTTAAEDCRLDVNVWED
jgi:hypothetical protein